MSSVRRPLVAVLTAIVLIAIQAVADPTGLLALVGWSGAMPSLATGLWTLAPYVVFIPVMLAMVWWAAARAGDRFWTLTFGVVLAVLVAQAAAALVMTWDLATAGYAAGFVTAKAIPAALIIAGVTRVWGGRTRRVRGRGYRVWGYAVLFAALAPLLAGHWWAGAAYAPGMPTPRLDSGLWTMILAVVILAIVAALSLRYTRSRIVGTLGGWIGALIAGGAFGLVQAAIGFFVDGGTQGDLWPLMVAYVAVADGMAFGACVGWIVGFATVAGDRLERREGRAGTLVSESGRAPQLIAASVAVLALVGAFVTPHVPAAQAVSPGPASTESVPEPAPGFLRTDGTHIADGHGNQVLLRGTNVNNLVDFYQARPDFPATRSLTESDYAHMAEYGFNVVRLNISWSALEPARGELSEAYLGRIHQAVDWGKKYGIYTVLDMHQDGWWNGPSEPGTVCRPGTDPMWGYDGAPEWATITDGAPRCQFTGRDISPAGDRAFQNFYFNTDGLRNALADTWGALAAEFKDEPMVAGFDLFNEPGFGETAPVTTAHLLSLFYAEAIDAIRAVGAPQIVFIEPSILWSGLGFDTGPTPGFTNDANIVFSPHLYAESITMDRDLGIPAIVGLERQFVLAERVAAQYDAPLWSGEYGY